MVTWEHKLLNWYDLYKRDLPWRRTSRPYDIWVSEIMLQQTRVETVAAYYLRWMERFPDVQSLARAELDEVLKQWEGLGYYSRARNMHKAAGVIVDQYGGEFPSVHADLLRLPGIGPYTAGAISSIAFDQPCPAVDGNVLRVMSRLFAWPDTADRAVQKQISDRVAESFPEGRASEFTQSLMELGALRCVPRNADCAACPVQEDCQANLQGMQEEWPYRVAKVPQKKIKRFLAIIIRDGEILMHRRPEKGLLAGLWEFPGVECQLKRDFNEQFLSEHGLAVQAGQHLLNAEHVFTHLKWEMKAYLCSLQEDSRVHQEGNYLWIPIQELHTLAIPTAFQAVKEVLMEN